VVGFEHGQVLLPQLAIAGVAGMQGKEERQIGVVRIEQVEVPEIEGVVARDRSQNAFSRL